MPRRPSRSSAAPEAPSTFAIDDYNWAPPFSSFLPGIAGWLGVPAWAYWVNRGQVLASVGVGDRDGQILELQSFNKACLRVPTEGFRTFLRLNGDDVVEPFRRARDPAVSQTLEVGAAEVSITEVDAGAGIRTRVTYVTLPGQRAAGVVRHVTVTDLTGSARAIEWLDGLPRVLPKGLDQHGIKVSPRHAEAMMEAVTGDGVAVFRLRQAAADEARVAGVEGAHFYAVAPAVPIICDPVAVFGDPFAVAHPVVFADEGVDGVIGARQIVQGRTPCAFAAHTDVLEAGGSISSTVVLGGVERLSDLDRLVEDLRRPGFAAAAAGDARRIVDGIADRAFTLSASDRFDAYTRQTFFDNVLRGGMPVSVASEPPHTFHVFWRQNADLERDYHRFDLEPTYLSQGMGHYRNVLQNRRSDAWFHPGAGDDDIATFAGLIQLDGYNPLEVRHNAYRLDADAVARAVSGEIPEAKARPALVDRLTSGPITPGRILMALEDGGADIEARWPSILASVLEGATLDEVGGLEAGFWIDHWHYNLDLIERFLSVYPDRLTELLVDPIHSFFDNPDVVLPRSQRVEVSRGRLRQHRSVSRNEEKAALIESRHPPRHRARDGGGRGDVVRTTLLGKLLLVAVTRLATLDPGGRGIEMEAGKPGWNDSLNGLPALFGSGLSELVELRRLVRLLLEWLDRLDPPLAGIEVHDELGELIDVMAPLVASSGDLTPGDYWDRANTAKEAYRESVRLGVSGRWVAKPREEIAAFLGAAMEMIDGILGGANGPVLDDGLPHTYFINEATDWRVSEGGVEPLAFSTSPAGVFLEGAVHWMREFPEQAPAIYDAVRRSELWDESLHMYKVSGPIGPEHAEMGRAVGAYPPGWLENESIYTHMEYKYLLEVLRSGLCDRFWDDARTALAPFLDPAVYGRSPAEGVSFIVSSAHPDPAEHGRGYQPRLSGVTAEFVEMWVLAMVGPRPFRLEDGGDLRFAVEPRLPAWLFAESPREGFHTMPDGSREAVEVPAGGLAFRMLGTVTVVLHNPERRDTFGPEPVAPLAYRLQYDDGRQAEISGAEVPMPHAAAIRAGRVTRLDVRLG